MIVIALIACGANFSCCSSFVNDAAAFFLVALTFLA
jgi:hypothetical protein